MRHFLIDFNHIIQFLNILILALTLLYFTENKYVDLWVIFAAAIIHVQVFIILMYEKRRANPFILILSFVVVVFYLLRISSLYIDAGAASLVFNRPGSEEIGSKEIFEFLIYIHWCIWAIFLGIKNGFGRPVFIENRLDMCEVSNKKYRLYVLYSFLALIALLLHQNVLGYSASGIFNPGLIFGLFAGVFDYVSIISLLTLLMLCNGSKIHKKLRLSALIVLFLILSTLIIPGGGTGSVYRFGLPILFAFFVVFGRLKIRLIYVVIVMFLGVITSIYGTYAKFNKDASVSILKGISESSLDGYELILSQVLARSAFLDFSVEIVNNANYNKLINLDRYFEAIVDTVTPGFDVYDTPLVANALQGEYRADRFNSTPKRSELFGEFYQSDQINVFAEYKVLFGAVFSLPLLAISAFMFSKIYIYIQAEFRDKFFGVFMSAVMLGLYYSWLKSFGLDWLFVEIKSAVIFLFVCYTFVNKLQNFIVSKAPLITR